MRTVRIIALSLLLLAMGSKMFAQAGATGTILGTVTDSAGAVVPDAKITVTNTATKVSFQTTSNNAGDYNAPALNPGSYSMTAEARGFQKTAISSFTLTVNQHARVDFTLRPGAVTETVETTAQAVSLDTDTAELSNLVSQQQVENLPLNGRNFMQLLLVGAGAVTVGGEQGTMRQGEGNAISVNGGRPEGNNYTLDGLVNTDAALVTPAVILSQDAIQEFKVSSGTYSADQGFSATQINIVSKGGTNNLHGAVFWFDRNDAFDAKPFPTANDYISGTPTANPVLHQNQFGFVAGGPIYIPHVYDGRNRSFFMANYEGWRISNGSRQVTTMPNPAILGGDFSAETYKAPAGSGLPGGLLPAYGTADCTKLLGLGYNCMPVDPTTGQAFSGNVIPSARQTGNVGLVAVQNGFWQTPTIANQPEGAVNYIKNVGFPLHQNQQTYRGDQNLGKFGSVFFRYTDANYSNQGSYNSGDLIHGYEIYLQNQTAWAVSHTINLGKTSVNNFRFGPSQCRCSAGRPGDHASCSLTNGVSRHVHQVFGAPADLAERRPVGPRVCQRRRFGQLLQRVDRANLGICGLLHFGSWKTHAWIRCGLSALAPDSEPGRRFLRRLGLLRIDSKFQRHWMHQSDWSLRYGQLRCRHAAGVLQQCGRFCARPVESDHYRRQSTRPCLWLFRAVRNG